MDLPAKTMSVEELNTLLESVVDFAKHKAKLSNMFIVYQVGQTMIREYPSGEKFELIYDVNGNQKEFPLHA